MSGISEAIHGIHHLEAMAKKDNFITRLHPLVKVLVTFWYILFVVSFDKYDLTGLLGMSLYLVVVIEITNISMRTTLRQMKAVIIMVCLVGIANPFLDRSVWMRIGDITITGGLISMMTLILKGVFALLASYLLIATTSMENICYALRLLHVPKLIVTVIMLIYRYIILFMKEVERISLAYSLRAPKQKGIHYKAWGSLLGQMLLRSIDRADIVYESMTIRGFKGDFYLRESSNQRLANNITSVLYLICTGSLITIFRIVPVFQIVGRIFE